MSLVSPPSSNGWTIPLKACCRREVAERRGAEDLHLLATDKITKEFFNLRLPVNTEVFKANLQQCTASLVRMYKEAKPACVPSKPERFFEQEKKKSATVDRKPFRALFAA
jgi:hypothetical protein